MLDDCSAFFPRLSKILLMVTIYLPYLAIGCSLSAVELKVANGVLLRVGRSGFYRLCSVGCAKAD